MLAAARTYRLGLFDQVLIKENRHRCRRLAHRSQTKQPAAPPAHAKSKWKSKRCRSLRKLYPATPDIGIMLDEFSHLDDIRAAVALNSEKTAIE